MGKPLDRKVRIGSSQPMKTLLAALILLFGCASVQAQTVPLGPRFVLPYQTVIDSGGVPLPGALLYFYSSGTNIPLNTYSDPLLTIPNSNPVVANSAGVFPNIFLLGNYKVILQNSALQQIWAADPVSGISSGGGISGVTSIGNFSGDNTIAIAGTGTGPWNGNVTVECTVATSSQVGCGKPDGTSLIATTGTWSVPAISINGTPCTPGGSCTPFANATSVIVSGGSTTTVVPTGSNGLMYNNSGFLNVLTFTAGLPLIGNGNTSPPVIAGSVTGNTTTFATSTGALNSGDCVSIDASGNFVDAGTNCGGGASSTPVNQFFATPSGTTITLTNTPLPTAAGQLSIFFDGIEQDGNTWSLNTGTGVVTFNASIPSNVAQAAAYWFAPGIFSGVSSITAGATTITGAVTLVAGTGITLTPSGQDITIKSSGVTTVGGVAGAISISSPLAMTGSALGVITNGIPLSDLPQLPAASYWCNAGGSTANATNCSIPASNTPDWH